MGHFDYLESHLYVTRFVRAYAKNDMFIDSRAFADVYNVKNENDLYGFYPNCPVTGEGTKTRLTVGERLSVIAYIISLVVSTCGYCHVVLAAWQMFADVCNDCVIEKEHFAIYSDVCVWLAAKRRNVAVEWEAVKTNSHVRNGYYTKRQIDKIIFRVEACVGGKQEEHQRIAFDSILYFIHSQPCVGYEFFTLYSRIVKDVLYKFAFDMFHYRDGKVCLRYRTHDELVSEIVQMKLKK